MVPKDGSGLDLFVFNPPSLQSLDLSWQWQAILLQTKGFVRVYFADLFIPVCNW